MIELSIMTECFADTLMIETFLPFKKRLNHKHSCFQVEKEMVTGKLKDKFAVGIIDKDKKSIKYLNEFIVIDKVENSLILWKNKSEEKHHYFIQIEPALEKWIINICDSGKITQEGIPLELEELRKYTKKQSSIKNESLKLLFGKMKSETENLSVRKLSAWIKLLIEKNYSVGIKELANV